LDATARGSGLTFTQEALTTAAEQLAGAVERDATGALTYSPEAGAAAFRIIAGEVVEIPAADFVAGVILEHAKPIPKSTPATAQEAPAPAIPSSAPQWAQRTRGPISDFARALAASEDAAIQREIAGWPNPWAKGSENRTRQAVIANRNTALAAQHKAQAGA
jgi:hypothetical protein